MEITSTEYHNKTAEEYDNNYKDPYWKIYNEVTWAYVKECLPKDKDGSLILDAGGGTGLWSVKLAEEGYRVILTDLSSGMLDIAKNKIKEKKLEGKIEVIESDITDMSVFENAKFDISLAEGDPVSYCSNPAKAISELSRVTKKGGFITVSVDNKLNCASRFIRQGEIEKADEILEKGIGYMWGKTPNEVYPAYMFTIEELKDLFIQNGIEPIKTIGKPVFINAPDCLEDENIFKKYLEFELKYSSLPSVAGRGGHIALVGEKK